MGAADDMGEDLRETQRNAEMGSKARAILQDLLSQTCRRGWHGDVTLTLSIKDGTIQHVTETKARRHK